MLNKKKRQSRARGISFNGETQVNTQMLKNEIFLFYIILLVMQHLVMKLGGQMEQEGRDDTSGV